jgi:hypothetical protein
MLCYQKELDETGIGLKHPSHKFLTRLVETGTGFDHNRMESGCVKLGMFKQLKIAITIFVTGFCGQ